VRHLFAALELGTDTMYGHIKKRKRRGEFLQFCRYVRGLHPEDARIAIVCDNFSPHLTARKDKRVGQWAPASNVELAHTPTKSAQPAPGGCADGDRLRQLQPPPAPDRRAGKRGLIRRACTASSGGWLAGPCRPKLSVWIDTHNVVSLD
jgi:hypothetical protein